MLANNCQCHVCRKVWGVIEQRCPWCNGLRSVVIKQEWDRVARRVDCPHCKGKGMIDPGTKWVLPGGL